MHTKRLPKANKTGRIARRLGFSLLTAVCLAGTGCQSLRDIGGRLHFSTQCDRYFAEAVACHEAKWAWLAYKGRCGAHSCLNDTKQGFVRGYVDTAMGGDGRSPIVPEERYWSTLYQSRYGQQRINSWYQGYPMGVDAARKKGHGYHLRTPVTEEVSAFFAATSPAGQRQGLMTPQQQHPIQPVQAAQPIQPHVDPGYQQPQTPGTATNAASSQPVMQEYIDLSQGTQIPMPSYQVVPQQDGTVEYHQYMDNPSDASSLPPAAGVFAPATNNEPLAETTSPGQQQIDSTQPGQVQPGLQQPQVVSPDSMRDYLNIPVDEVSSPQIRTQAEPLIRQQLPAVIQPPVNEVRSQIPEVNQTNPFALPAQNESQATPQPAAEATEVFGDFPAALQPANK